MIPSWLVMIDYANLYAVSLSGWNRLACLIHLLAHCRHNIVLLKPYAIVIGYFS